MDSTLVQAQSYANGSMRELGYAAKRIDHAVSEFPHYTERLQRLAEDLWAMEKATRAIEGELADINAELRARA